MKTLTLKALPVAAALTIALGLGMGAAREAHAFAYAYSDLQLTNGSITVLTPGSTSPTTFGACLLAGCASFGTPATSSSAQATLGGSGASVSGLTDSPVAIGTGSVFPGATPVNNAFVLSGSTALSSYTWADSVISSQQALGTPPFTTTGAPNFASKINTQQIAEGNSIGPLGTSGGTTTSATALTTALVVTGNGARVLFDLNLILNMLAQIVAPSTGIQAIGSAGVLVQITNSLGATVFIWNVGSTPLGAATFSNAFAFTNVSTTTPGSIPFSNSGDFTAVTNDLTAGTYQLSLLANAQETVQSSVPEPGSLALFGIAFLGLYGTWRMRRGS